MSSPYIETGLSIEAREVHQALASLQEELEAIDYYHQRADVTEDASLKAVLTHNRDDEMEHAMMLLEWLRRSMPEFDGQMRKFLFTQGDLVALAAGKSTPVPDGKGLGLGNLRKEKQS
jgi:ferritin-like protein